MGSYTRIDEPGGRCIQIKSGFGDSCSTYKLGDEVPFLAIHKDYPGDVQFADGVYDGLYEDNLEPQSAWVVISNHRVAAIVPRHYIGYGKKITKKDIINAEKNRRDYEDLYRIFKIQPPPASLWTPAAWRKKKKKDAKLRRETARAYKKYRKSGGHALLFPISQPLYDTEVRGSKSFFKEEK